MEQEQLERLSTLFKALADPMRLQILGLLASRPRAGHELAKRPASLHRPFPTTCVDYWTRGSSTIRLKRSHGFTPSG